MIRDALKTKHLKVNIFLWSILTALEMRNAFISNKRAKRPLRSNQNSARAKSYEKTKRKEKKKQEKVSEGLRQRNVQLRSTMGNETKKNSPAQLLSLVAIDNCHREKIYNRQLFLQQWLFVPSFVSELYLIGFSHL